MNKQIITRPGALLAPQLDYILVDGSGSMLNKWWDSMAALDGFIRTLKDANLNSHLIASVFTSGNISMIQRDQRIAEWQPFSDEPLTSYWGGTPLYDAIHAMGVHLRDLNPTRASVVVVTDGHENGSTLDVTQAASIINWLKAKGYQVTFIGCDFNNSEQAKALGISDANSVGVQKSLLTDAAKNLGEKRKRHYHTGQDMHFTGSEKSQFGGYLTGGK